MLDNGSITKIILGAAGLIGGGGIVALFKVNAQRKHIIVETAEGAVIVASGVLKELREELTRLKDELTTNNLEYIATKEQLGTENAALRKQQAASEAVINRLRSQVDQLHGDSARYGRIAESLTEMMKLGRRRSHVLSNAMSALELMIYNLIREVRDKGFEVPKDLYPSELCAKVRDELQEISDLESKLSFVFNDVLPDRSENIQ